MNNNQAIDAALILLVLPGTLLFAWLISIVGVPMMYTLLAMIFTVLFGYLNTFRAYMEFVAQKHWDEVDEKARKEKEQSNQ